MKVLDKQARRDVLLGCAVLGCGGGGELDRGLRQVEDFEEKGVTLRLADLSEVPDNLLVASPYYCGAVSPEGTRSLDPSAAGLEPVCQSEPAVAFQALEEAVGSRFYGVLSTELGGGNTAVAMAVAAERGLPLIDADPAGRSVPELIHSTLSLSGVSIAPFAVATRYGEVMVVRRVPNDIRAEALARSVAVLSGGRAGVCDHPVTGARLKTAVIPRAISHAERIGRALREAREKGRDPVPAVAEEGCGAVIFEGVVREDSRWEDRNGVTEGDVFVDGRDQFHGRECRVNYRNEHMAAWLDGEIAVTVPDLITLLERESGQPLLNPVIRKGTRLAVVVMPAPEAWRTPAGLRVLGPAYLGLGVKYTPVEVRFGRGKEGTR
ncbi:MAG: DUF917 domain-containing protein [Firmicutes bacterium]|nr:DUF917 domain-containing protein [Bacillota bacterium]